MAEKLKEWGPLGFFNIHSLAKHQKIVRGPLGENFFFEKKDSQCRNQQKWGTIQSLPVWYVTRKRGKTIWFSSLDQMIQFGTMKFCRTFKNYFGQFVWTEKKRGKKSL